jgi:hypothetical protein
MAGAIAGVREPLDATAAPSVARASCAMVLPTNARGRPVRDGRVRFGGKHCGATAIRVSAGSFRSLTSLRRNARCAAAGWSNPIDRILSRRIVRRFGVPRFRPPRRSPGLEPRSMFHSPGSSAALRAWVAHAQHCRERAAGHRFPTHSISPPVPSCRLIVNNSLLPPLSLRYSIATRALEASSTLKLRRRAKSSYQKALILPIQCTEKNFWSQNSAPCAHPLERGRPRPPTRQSAHHRASYRIDAEQNRAHPRQ